jgi:hypothetical protein
MSVLHKQHPLLARRPLPNGSTSSDKLVSIITGTSSIRAVATTSGTKAACSHQHNLCSLQQHRGGIQSSPHRVASHRLNCVVDIDAWRGIGESGDYDVHGCLDADGRACTACLRCCLCWCHWRRYDDRDNNDSFADAVHPPILHSSQEGRLGKSHSAAAADLLVCLSAITRFS